MKKGKNKNMDFWLVKIKTWIFGKVEERGRALHPLYAYKYDERSNGLNTDGGKVMEEVDNAEAPLMMLQLTRRRS